ncbi:hypothetical protein ACJD0Z_13250 [Flavobacteriaceae bacterium M23B6Z8]
MHELAIFQLRKNLDVFLNLIKSVNEDQRQWRSPEQTLTIHEILCHLYEMELYYFRPQTEWISLHPNQKLQEIDTSNWCDTRRYATNDFRVTLRRFVIEREASVRWLSSLDDTFWESSFIDHSSGKVSSKMFLMSWLNNDYTEFQKIVKLKYEYFNAIEQSQNPPLKYAGNL